MSINWDTAVLGPLMKQFGEDFTFAPIVSDPTADPYKVTGVFDEAYKEVDLAGGTGTVTEAPVLGTQAAQFRVEPKQGDQATRLKNGALYELRERPHFDGHGSAKLLMNYIGP